MEDAVWLQGDTDDPQFIRVSVATALRCAFPAFLGPMLVHRLTLIDSHRVVCDVTVLPASSWAAERRA